MMFGVFNVSSGSQGGCLANTYRLDTVGARGWLWLPLTEQTS